MTVMEIVEKYLKENEYDGLFCEDCGCEIGNLLPCGGENVWCCKAGYKHYDKDNIFIISKERR